MPFGVIEEDLISEFSLWNVNSEFVTVIELDNIPKQKPTAKNILWDDEGILKLS